MRCAVVPIKTDFLRSAADTGKAKEGPVIGTIEVARRKGELPQLPSDCAPMQLPIIVGERPGVAVKQSADRRRGELAMLECAGDALAHQRIDAGGVARQNHPPLHVSIAGVEPSDGIRLEANLAIAQTRQWQLGKSPHKLAKHRCLLAAGVSTFARELVVDADVQMRPPADRTGKRPGITLDSRGDASKVKAVAAFRELDVLVRVRRKIGHQRSPNCFLAVPEDRSSHDASGPISSDEDGRLEVSGVGPCTHASVGLLDTGNPAMLDNSEPRIAGRAGEERIEFVAANDRSYRFVPLHKRIAHDRARRAPRDGHVRNIESDLQFVEGENRLGNQTARTRFESRMSMLLESDDSTAQFRAGLEQIKRRGQTGGAGARD